MKTRNSANPFLLVALVVIFLWLVSFFKAPLLVGALELRPVSLLADVLRQPVRHVPHPAISSGASGHSVGTSDHVALTSFLHALQRTKATGRKTRIAYFGDSMIEGDLITGDLRQALQVAFGGEGVGFVPVTSATADFRTTIHQQFSTNWQPYDLVSPRLPTAHPLGLSGHVFVAPAVRSVPDTGAAPGAAWVQFEAGRPYQAVRQLSRARLLIGPGDTRDQVVVRFGPQQTRVTLSDTALLSGIALTASSARQLRLTFNCRAPRSVYGVSFESAQGITLDNFSFRGSSGLSLRRISPKMLAAFNEQQPYDLLILHYGVNVANARLTNYHNYTRALGRIIDRLQAACPQASILLIGMGDKGYRWQGEVITDPSVPRLLAAQQRLAVQKHIAFWNLFEAMGGENTMARWVEASPALANRDYTHLNARGARKVADLLYQFLMQQYQVATKRLPPASVRGPMTASRAASY